MAKKEEPKYLPQVVSARLKTATTLDEVRQQLSGQGFTRNEMKAMVRCMNFFDGLEVFLSKWNWDNYKNWHLYNWKQTDDETVMKAIFEAEQLHPFSCGRYKNDFAQFEKDWKAETYDPGATLAFEDAQVEVLEVLQEEVNNIDTEEVKKAVRKAEDVRRDRKSKRHMRASKGSRYKKKFF